MSDLISRSALLGRLADRAMILDEIDQCSAETVRVDMTIITRSPAVDAVEVCRCKDCKHFLTEKLLCTHEGNMVFNTGKTTYPNCFCSYGERREDG